MDLKNYNNLDMKLERILKTRIAMMGEKSTPETAGMARLKSARKGSTIGANAFLMA